MCQQESGNHVSRAKFQWSTKINVISAKLYALIKTQAVAVNICLDKNNSNLNEKSRTKNAIKIVALNYNSNKYILYYFVQLVHGQLKRIVHHLYVEFPCKLILLQRFKWWSIQKL